MKKFRHILANEKDIIGELLEQPFVKGCKIKEIKGRDGLIDIYVEIPFFETLFRRKKRLDDIHNILRPKMSFMITYEVHIKLFI